MLQIMMPVTWSLRLYLEKQQDSVPAHHTEVCVLVLELFLACSHICVAPWSNGVMAAGDAVALAASLAAASV